MRTCTKRWVAIVAVLTLPVGTGIALHQEIRQPDRMDAPVDLAPCAGIEDLAKVDEVAARERAETLVKAEKTPDVTRLCAAELKQRYAPAATAVGRVERAVDRVVAWAIETVGGEPTRLTGDENRGGPVAGALLGLNLLLVLVAVRQVVLWRAERDPGPVQIGEIATPHDDAAAVNLSHILRTTLAEIGIAPGVAAPGELSAVIIDAVTDAAVVSPSKLVGRVVAALPRALVPKGGFLVTARAFRQTRDDRCAVSLEVTVARTGVTFTNVDGSGDTYADAAEDAAYELFCRLVERGSVRRRTPAWLAWTSKDTVRAYGKAKALPGHVEAAEALAALSQREPGNVMVLLAAAARSWEAGWSTPDEQILRGSTSTRPEPILDAVDSVLQVFHRVPRYDLALFDAAIYLSYIAEWGSGWSGSPRAKRVRIASALERAVVGTAWWRRRWPVDPDADAVQFSRRVRQAGVVLNRCAVRNQRLHRVLLGAWSLAQRREYVERAWPWSQLRLRRRHVALALLDAATWDRHRLDGRFPFMIQQVTSWIRRARIRSARLLLRGSTLSIDWNLAIAYSCQSLAMRSRPQPASDSPAEIPERASARELRRALFAASGRLRAQDVDDALVTPELQRDGTMASFVVPVLGPLVLEGDDARQERIWKAQMEEVRKTVEVATAAWHHHLRLLPVGLWARVRAQGHGPPSVDDVVEWFRQDAELWKALTAWIRDPADEKARAALAKARDPLKADLDWPGRPHIPEMKGRREELDALGSVIATRAALALDVARGVELAAVDPSWHRGSIARASALEASAAWRLEAAS